MTTKSKTAEEAKEEVNLGFVENFALSGAAAVISKTLAAPIERVKMLVQNQSEMIRQGRLERPYNGIIDCTKHTLDTDGVLSFWRGNFTNVIRYFPTQALNFAFKETLRDLPLLHTPDGAGGAEKLAKYVTTGGMAGSLSLLFVYSLDYARTRLANNVIQPDGSRAFNGLIDVYIKTIKSDGFLGLYRGFVISCIGIFVYRGIYFGLYDFAKPMLFGDDAGLVLSFLLGWGVTNLAGLMAYPIDTIRRRMMMTSGQKVKYKSTWDATRSIAKEGPAMMFKGAGANIMRGLASAGVLAGYDRFKDMYIRWRLSQQK